MIIESLYFKVWLHDLGTTGCYLDKYVDCDVIWKKLTVRAKIAEAEREQQS